MHKSVKLNTPVEFINVTPVNPLISKCQIKVCYVSDEPNRNKSVIDKESAKKMANSLPGCPIVGFYNEEKGDFEEHNRIIDISNGKFEIKDTTRPYGFVDLSAKVWFQKFLDDGKDEREYMMTEGWLWTGQYPECARILAQGNNQSMELDEKNLNAHWSKNENGEPEFFIINEAIISKLCILGEENEPCFEGANISEPVVQFSFGDGFKEQLFSMINELKEFLNEGGKKVFTRYAVEVGDNLWNALYTHLNNSYEIVGVYEEENQKFAVVSAEDKFYRLNITINEEEITFGEEYAVIEDYVADDEPQFSTEAVEAYKNVKAEEEKEEKCPECGKPLSECECEKGKNDKYNLEEIQEYVELKEQYSALEIIHNQTVQALEAAQGEIEELKAFKVKVEKAEKQKMIDGFYMLSDEDKADVIQNIDTYSLEDIESKLSIICVRNKVSFNQEENSNPTVYNFNGGEGDDDVPAWVKAVRSVSKDL